MTRGGNNNPKGRPKGSTTGRKPRKTIVFDNDVLEWIDGMRGNRSKNVSKLLRALMELDGTINVTKS